MPRTVPPSDPHTLLPLASRQAGLPCPPARSSRRYSNARISPEITPNMPQTALNPLNNTPTNPCRHPVVQHPPHPSHPPPHRGPRLHRIVGGHAITLSRKTAEARGMRAWGHRRVGGHGRTPGLRLCTRQMLNSGRKSRDLAWIRRDFACTSGHVPASMDGISVFPPPNDRGNASFSPCARQGANNMGRLWGGQG